MNDISSLLDFHWYAQEQGSIVPIGNEYKNDIHKRPDCIYT